jgi:phosphopentomutase
MKPDVIQHMNKLKKEREFTIQYGNKLLSGTEIINQLNQQQHYIKLLHEKIAKLEQELKKSSTP